MTTKPNSYDIEILAPAGSFESVVAAVRLGADAVYLGGQTLNARRGAANFDKTQLLEAVSYCHARGVRVYQTINTVVFDDELADALEAIKTACDSGVDALIIQDLAVARLARECAPTIELHASTQMSVHNLEGVKALEELGFSRVVVARELSLEELSHMKGKTSVQLESFVHGALCMSLSGGCYLSSMIGGRSGNRGMCAQPCRLPFASEKSSHALSLKDLTLIKNIAELREAGIVSLKIEGRLKRPEYVAAAVAACRLARAGEKPDMEALAAVFSRSGFTNAYFLGNCGDHMFGLRRHEDVTAAASVLKKLAATFRAETPRVGLGVKLQAKKDKPVVLIMTDGDKEYRAEGEPPQIAQNTATTPERAEAALCKTGGTPFEITKIECDIDEGLMLPASQLNALRRQLLEEVLAERSRIIPHKFKSTELPKPKPRLGAEPVLRVRLEKLSQLSRELYSATSIVLPLDEIDEIGDIRGLNPDKIILELPRIFFGDSAIMREQLEIARDIGINKVLAGNLGGIGLARELGFEWHGDFTLNLTNELATEELNRLGCKSVTASIECSITRLRRLGTAEIPVGAVGYGYLPLMATRCRPAGMESDEGALTDRLGNSFRVAKTGEAYTLYNCVPLWLAERTGEFAPLSFLTLYFTNETAAQCAEIYKAYENKQPPTNTITRGLYYREVK